MWRINFNQIVKSEMSCINRECLYNNKCVRGDIIGRAKAPTMVGKINVVYQEKQQQNKLGLKIERKSLFKLHNINERAEQRKKKKGGRKTQLGLMERGGAHCTAQSLLISDRDSHCGRKGIVFFFNTKGSWKKAFSFFLF